MTTTTQDLPPNIQKQLSKTMDCIESLFLIELDKCQSPIEQMLLIEWLRVSYLFDSIYPGWEISLLSQFEIKSADGLYRVDFALRIRKNDKCWYGAVECDSHEYHADKESMASDYARMRFIQTAGYEVIRFTGSEIFKSPGRCVKDVVSIIESRMKDLNN